MTRIPIGGYHLITSPEDEREDARRREAERIEREDYLAERYYEEWKESKAMGWGE